LGTEHLCHQ